MTLWFLTAVIELFAVVFAAAGFDEVADALPFSRSGTAVAVVVIVVIALIGAIAAWRGAGGVFRAVIAIALSAAAGVVAVMAIFLLVFGGTPAVLAVVLALTVFSIVMIARAVWQSGPSRTRR